MKVNEYHCLTTLNTVRRYGTDESAAEAWKKYQESPNYEARRWKGIIGLYYTDNVAQASKLYLTFDTSGLKEEMEAESAILTKAWLHLRISTVYNYKGLDNSVTLQLYHQAWGVIDVSDWGGGSPIGTRNLSYLEGETIYDKWILIRIPPGTINTQGLSQYKVSLTEIENDIIPWPDGNGVAIYVIDAKVRCKLTHPLAIPYVPSPKSYTSLEKPHTHTSWDCTEIVWNYFDWCMRYTPFLSQSQITDLPINDVEKIQYFLFRPAIIHPSSENLSNWELPQNRIGDKEDSIPHQDNPKYQAEYFDAYQRHRHTPFEGGEIIWNNIQWTKKLNTEIYIWKQNQLEAVGKGFESQFGENFLPEPSGVLAYNRHPHGQSTGGIIAQNKWMKLAVQNQRIYELNQNLNKGEFDYVLSEPPGLDENTLFEESQKSGTPSSGAETFGYKSIAEIDNPIPSGTIAYNPSITTPAFGTEVIYNDKQLTIVLNKLINEGLIRRPEAYPSGFEVPGEPTNGYNVHFHTGPYDGGHLINHEHSDDSCGPIAANDFMETAIRNRRIDRYNETAPSGEEISFVTKPYDFETLAKESQKSGVVPSGKEDLGYKSVTEITEIDSPVPSGVKIYNPVLTVPSFGTEVVFNDKQLAIILNKLIDEELIAFPSGIVSSGMIGERFLVPEKPTKGYNVHFHTSLYDGGCIAPGGVEVGLGLVIPWEERERIFP